jgi:hypothetical protein
LIQKVNDLKGCLIDPCQAWQRFWQECRIHFSYSDPQKGDGIFVSLWWELIHKAYHLIPLIQAGLTAERSEEVYGRQRMADEIGIKLEKIACLVKM